MSKTTGKFSVKEMSNLVSDVDFLIPPSVLEKMEKDLKMQMSKVIPVAPIYEGMQGKMEVKYEVKQGDYISASEMSVTSMMAYDLAKQYGIDKTSYEKLSNFLLVWMGLQAELYSIRKDINKDLFTAEQTSMRYYGGPMSGKIRSGCSSHKAIIVPIQMGVHEGIGVSSFFPDMPTGGSPVSIKQFTYNNIQGKWSDQPLTERSWVLA